MKKVTDKNTYLIFMSDGGGKYPQKQIDDIKIYTDTLPFKNSQKFEFCAIGF